MTGKERGSTLSILVKTQYREEILAWMEWFKISSLHEVLSAEITFLQMHWSHLLALILDRKDLGISTFIDKSTSGNEALIWFVWREWVIDFFLTQRELSSSSSTLLLVYRWENWVNRLAPGHRVTHSRSQGIGLDSGLPIWCSLADIWAATF